jgi:hypothetical protein
VSRVDFGHKKRAGHLGGRQMTATTAVGLGRSQRAAAFCVAVDFLSTRPTSVLFGMAPASTQRRLVCVHPGSFMSASLLDAGCGIRTDQKCVVRAVAECSAATFELAVRLRTRARAHSHRSLMNKAQSTEAPTAAARACRPGRVGVGYLWPDVEWERRHVAQVWFSDHHIIAENPAATTKERRAAMGGRCPVVSAVGRTGEE